MLKFRDWCQPPLGTRYRPPKWWAQRPCSGRRHGCHTWTCCWRSKSGKSQYCWWCCSRESNRKNTGRMGPLVFGKPRYQAPSREHSLGQTLGAGSDYRRSVEPVDSNYLEDLVRRLVSEYRYRTNDDWGTYASRNSFTEDILQVKYPRRFIDVAIQRNDES